jgi:hypothetical protein
MGGSGPFSGEQPGGLEVRVGGLAQVGVELGGPLGCVLDVVQLATQLFAFGQDVLERGAVLPLHALQDRQPILHLLQAGGRRVDGGRIVTNEEREILEL